MKFTKHETAIVDDNCTIGDETKIWHWVHICSGAEIGKKCSLGQGVYVAGNVKIGNGVKVQNNVSVYDNVVLEDDVFCGPSMVFTNVYNPRSYIERKEEYRDTLVKKGATIGANATIVCGVTIGEFAFIGAGATVNQNVPSFALMLGLPAKQVGWMSKYGERLNLPLNGNAEDVCNKTGEVYVLHGDVVRIKK